MKRSHPILLCLLAASLSLAHVAPASSALAANPPAAKQSPAAVAKKPTSLMKVRAKIPPAKNLPAKNLMAKNLTVKHAATDEAVAPRLTLSLALAAPMAVALPAAVPVLSAPAPAPIAMQPRTTASAAPASVNPYLAYRQEAFAAPVTAALETPVVVDAPREKANLVSQYFSGFQLISPVRPPSDQSILPKFKKVYPTGEKPLVVMTFKCPTELIGITPLPTKALHGLVDLGLGALNSSNLLSFNMQQVCQ